MFKNQSKISKCCCLISILISNKCRGWNTCGGGAKVAKSINVEVGISMEGGIFWKKTST